MFTALAFCALAQATRAEVADLEFTRVGVEWIAATGVVHDFSQVLPERQALLLRSLGCEHYGCRTLARDELAGMGRAAGVALCWGMRAKDFGIAAECRALYGRLCRCRKCDGVGRIPYGVGDYTSTCEDCGGLGDLRLEKRWAEGEEVVVPAELFRRRAK
jgi:hypothetical protein